MKRILSLFALSLLLFQANAGNPGQKISRQEYIDSWKRVAVDNMKKFRIPASIILAQGILESSCGNSELATQANNHFGIKCHDWVGNKYFYDDDAKQECFRKYESAAQSYADHGEFLTKRSRYASLFQLDPKDYKGWAYGLKKAGYATNPAYPELIIKIIEESKLAIYDEGVIIEETPVVKEEPAPAVAAAQPVKRTGKNRKEEVTIYLDHEVLVSDNKIKYIESRAGDTPQKLSKELDMGLWQILKYNDFDKSTKLKPGDVVYLQPKRRKAKLERHTVKSGETLMQISQLYGIKLNRLYKMNDLAENSKIKEGYVLKLR
ncbi:MAG: glucosaminidase domain-containing protein [Bacteroidota bacterium]